MQTRRSTRSVSSQAPNGAQSNGSDDSKSSPRKRTSTAQTEPLASPAKKRATGAVSPKKSSTQNGKSSGKAKAEEEPLPELLDPSQVHLYTTVPYPTLPFDLSAATLHLTRADPRFTKLVDLVELRPFLELAQGQVKELDLFKTLTTSILGQQISWLAARSVLYKFVRLFFADSLPEKPDFDATPRESLPFPTPHQVLLDVGEAELRSAGLSGQKVKYITDVARRFADGRLDARKLMQMEEEEVVKQLVQIK